jgi:hypothetical protein
MDPGQYISKLINSSHISILSSLSDAAIMEVFITACQFKDFILTDALFITGNSHSVML